MPASSTLTLHIYDPGWTNGRALPISDLSATWAISQPGKLSAVAFADDVHRMGFLDLQGRWVHYQHPTQGAWGGVIDEEPGDLGHGTVNLAASSMLMLFDDRTTPILFQQESGHAGALMRRALTFAQTDAPLPLRGIFTDEIGPIVGVEWRGDSLLAVAGSLANLTGQEFTVTVDEFRQIDFYWRALLGADKRDRVLIAEGRQIADGKIDRSRLAVVNEIIGVAADQDYERSVAGVGRDELSIKRYGLRQQVRRYDNVTTDAGVQARIDADIRNEAGGIALPTLTLPALHPVALDLREGDTVRLWSHTKNREYDFRILSRTVKNDQQLDLAGIATEVRVPPIVPPFTPDVLSGLRVWLDAQDAATLKLTPGDRVMRWLDKSPSQLEFRGDGFLPTYLPDDLNDRPVISCTASNALVAGLTAPYLNLSNTSAVTLFVIARNIDPSATRLIGFPDALFWVTPPPMDFSVGRDASGKISGIARELGATPATMLHANSWGTSAYHLVTLSVDLALTSNEPVIYDNGASSGTRPNNGNNVGPMDGTNRQMVIWSKWNVAEVILYDRVLTAAQQQAVEAYLRKRWGIS